MRHLQALAQQDNRTERRVAIALSMARHEQFGDAVGTLSQTVERDPNDSRVQLALGRIHLAKAEHSPDAFALAEARAALEKALGGTARRSEGLALYGRVLFLSGEVATAERILLDAVATTPVDPMSVDAMVPQVGQGAVAVECRSGDTGAREALATIDDLATRQAVECERAFLAELRSARDPS